MFFQSLRGPRGGMIFYKKDTVLGVDMETAINNAVFPGLQVRCYWSLNLLFFLCPAVYLHLVQHSCYLFLNVFIVLQGGPHNHTIGGLAVCLKHAQSPEFKAYQNNVNTLFLLPDGSNLCLDSSSLC